MSFVDAVCPPLGETLQLRLLPEFHHGSPLARCDSSGKPKVPLALVPTLEGWKAGLILTDLTPSLATQVPNLPPACMACMCVPPVGWWQPPGWSQFFFKTLGEGPKLVSLKREFPLLTVPTPQGWKAEYTLASRMQIYESLTVLALLTSGEA